MKVKCILPVLNDLEAKTTRKLGEIFEVTEERAKYLAGANPNKIVAVEIIEEVKEKIEIDGKEVAEKVKEIVEQPKKEEKVVKKPVKKAKNVSRETKKKK